MAAMKDHDFYMQIALALAEKAAGYTSPNPMVGAVVVDASGRIVGQGYHRAVGESHAEVNAIDEAGEAARGATLYVTLEPCNHTGRTPPCTRKILESGIENVIVAMPDPNPSVVGGGSDYLISHGIAVTVGVCEEAARRLNEAFITYVTTRRPFVTLKCAMTLDGRIATRTGDSKWITGEASRHYVHALRHASDAILVGAGTVRKDDPSLTARIPLSPDGRKPVDPLRIVLDTRLTISETSRVLHLDSKADTLIVTGPEISDIQRNKFQKKGVRFLTAPLYQERIDLNWLMGYLKEELEVSSVLVEGGSRVSAAALASGIVDKIMFFYAPKILGGDDGVPVCKAPGPEWMKDSISIKRVAVRRFDDDILVEGYLHPDPRPSEKEKRNP